MNEVDAIKNEIRNLPYYEAEMQRLKLKLMQIEYAEENVKGVSFDRQPGTTNPSIIAENRLALIDEKLKVEQQVNEILCLVNRILRLLNAMEKDDRKLVMEILVDRKPYLDVCKERGIASTSVLHRRINAIIEEAIKKA